LIVFTGYYPRISIGIFSGENQHKSKSLRAALFIYAAHSAFPSTGVQLPAKMAKSSERALIPAFANMRDKWVFTVFSETKRRSAISLLRFPSSASSVTSTSRGENQRSSHLAAICSL